MKTAAHIIFIGLLAVNFCKAQIEESMLWDQIEECRTINYGDTDCLDVDKVESCLKNIVLVDESDGEEIQWNLDDINKHNTACPGLNTKDRCIASETYECMKHLYWKNVFGSKEVCNELAPTRRCLVRFNATCNMDVIDEKILFVDDIERMCQSGYYNDGPCSPKAIMNCSTPVFHDRKPVDLNDPNAVIQHNCKPSTVAASKQCLGALRSKCTTDDQQKAIQDEWDPMIKACPSSK